MVSLEKLKAIAEFINSKISIQPKIGIICGSGLGGLAELVTDKLIIPYSEINGFPESTVVGHKGNLVFGYLGGKEVVLMQGRFHPYEGYTTQTCIIPVRVMHLIGVKFLLLTNAAGGLNPSYKLGDLMIIKDHINFPGLCGFNPLVGPNEESLGERFIPLSDAYDKNLRLKAKKIIEKLGESNRVHEGVYAMQTGPAFETVSECRMMQICGGDVCGMSTVHEVIIARHMNMHVFAMSIVTDECILEYDSENTTLHEEILKVSENSTKIVQKIVTELISEITV